MLCYIVFFFFSQIAEALAETSEETNKRYAWLMHNISPWDEVVECWRNTCQKRYEENKPKSIHEIFTKWKVLENPQGLDLVGLLFCKLLNVEVTLFQFFRLKLIFVTCIQRKTWHSLKTGQYFSIP